MCGDPPLTTALTSTWWRIHGSASPWPLTKPPSATGRGSSVGRGTGRYHLTVARDGTWRIEKVADGQLITLSFGRTKGAIPATGLISLRAVCTGGEQGKPVQLALWGNGGKLLGRAADPDPLPLGRSGWQLSRPTPTRFRQPSRISPSPP